jgi:cytochrome c
MQTKKKSIFIIQIAVLAILLLTTFIISPVYSATNSKRTTFTDNFASKKLNAIWTIVDPSGGSTFDLAAYKGWLRITTTSPPERDLYQPVNVNAPCIMINGITGNFIVETQIMADTDQEWESDGILIWKDSNNFIRLDRACGADLSQRIVFIMSKDGGWDPMDVVLSSNMNPTYLRMARTGDIFSGFYSSDGITWTHIGDLTFAVTDPVDVGLDIVNVYHDGTFHADFNFFRLTAIQ